MLEEQHIDKIHMIEITWTEQVCTCGVPLIWPRSGPANQHRLCKVLCTELMDHCITVIVSQCYKFLQWYKDTGYNDNDTMIQWYNDTLIHWYTDTMTHWYTDTLKHWNTETLMQWCNDTMIHVQWYTDTMTQWYNTTMIQMHCHCITSMLRTMTWSIKAAGSD